MKLIKIFSDRVQIKTDSVHLAGIKINDLLQLSDGTTAIICIVTGITSNDSLAVVNFDDLSEFDQDLLSQSEANNTIECGILGSLRGRKFTKSIDVYPTTKVDVSPIDSEAFLEMLDWDDSAFQLGSYASYATPAMIDGNKLFQRHFAIMGNTGSGKSVTVASLLEKAASKSSSNVILFDLHGEYSGLPFAKTVKIGNGGLDFPLWFLPFRDIYGSMLRLKDESATLQLSALRKAFYKARNSDKGEELPLAFFTSTLLYDLKEQNEDVVFTGEYYKTGDRAGEAKTVKGENNGKLTSVITLLEDKLTDSRYEFMAREHSQNYLYEFLDSVFSINEKNVKIIDLSDAPHDMIPVIVAVVTKLIYSVQLQQKRESILPLCIVCEEAHVYIPSSDFGLGASQRRLLEIFETIAKEGRKFGTTLCIVSQRPSELNKTIMAQCANFIVMKMTNESDKSMIKGILPESSRAIIDMLSLFSAGDCFVIGDSAEITLKTRVDMPSHEPKSNTISTWDIWGQAHTLDVAGLVDGLLEVVDA